MWCGVADVGGWNAGGCADVGTGVKLLLYTSAFCAPCMQARSVLSEAAALVPGAVVEERDVAFRMAEAEADGIRSTPTVIVQRQDGVEVFRASGAPTLNQVLVAAAKAL